MTLLARHCFQDVSTAGAHEKKTGQPKDWFNNQKVMQPMAIKECKSYQSQQKVKQPMVILECKSYQSQQKVK